MRTTSMTDAGLTNGGKGGGPAERLTVMLLALRGLPLLLLSTLSTPEESTEELVRVHGSRHDHGRSSWSSLSNRRSSVESETIAPPLHVAFGTLKSTGVRSCERGGKVEALGIRITHNGGVMDRGGPESSSWRTEGSS
jgi:hypothetical protein